MKHSSSTLFLFAGLAAFLMLILAPKVATVQNSTASASSALRQPIWDSIKINDNTDTRLFEVPTGLRFVLTDMWFLSREGEVISRNSQDRVWLESREDRQRYVVFDSPLKELPDPLRWQTGITFSSSREMWLNYKASPANNSLRRVLFSGYLEADAKAARY